MPAPILFRPLSINGLTIKNRFVRSATVDNLGKDGRVTPAQMNLYRELARGGVGLIISHGLYPSKDGHAAPGQLGIHRDESVSELKKLVEIVHDNGGKIAAQLMHAGWYSNPENSGFQPVGPSAMVNAFSGIPCRELSSDEVEQHIDDFVQAGRRAFEAGYDGVQLHGAHSWFLSSFLSPATNHRSDKWGGTSEKRASIVVKIVEGIRTVVPANYPILIKLGLKDYHPQGKTTGEGINSVKMLVEVGLDALEISEGVEGEAFHHIRRNVVNPYYVDECRQARQALNIPIILVGGMRKLEDIEKVVSDGTADAISMCRPFIMEPHLVNKFRKGELDNSACTSCNGCIEAMHQGNIHCILLE